MKLTDEELSGWEAVMLESRHRQLTLSNEDALALITELRQLRALLATPMPCGFDEPRVEPEVGPNMSTRHCVVWEGIPYDADEAAAIGAAWIRAALAARGETP